MALVILLAACTVPSATVSQPYSPLAPPKYKYRYFVPYLVGAPKCNATSATERFASLLTGDSGQRRPLLRCNDKLTAAAMAKAVDMARRGYVSHTSPDGVTPNQLARWHGCQLPKDYPAVGNQIESIAAGMWSADTAYASLRNSSAHRVHLLAESSFFAGQSDYGIGYAVVFGSPYTFYWVFMSGKCNG